MKVGIVVPQFRDSPVAAIEAAQAAEEYALDGVFCFDHLWDLDKGSGPSLSCFPLLAAIAARTNRINVGTLVARVATVDNNVLESEFRSVIDIAGAQRVIAGLGTGDKLSAPENDAYGIPFPPLDERIEVLDDAIVRLQATGVTIWVGGRSDRLRRAAERRGVTVNQWDVDADALRTGDTWGGPWRGEQHMDRLIEAGVPWAVFLVPGVGKDPETAIRTVAQARSR